MCFCHSLGTPKQCRTGKGPHMSIVKRLASTKFISVFFFPFSSLILPSYWCSVCTSTNCPEHWVTMAEYDLLNYVYRKVNSQMAPTLILTRHVGVITGSAETGRCARLCRLPQYLGRYFIKALKAIDCTHMPLTHKMNTRKKKKKNFTCISE